jgi:hypothetical protein
MSFRATIPWRRSGYFINYHFERFLKVHKSFFEHGFFLFGSALKLRGQPSSQVGPIFIVWAGCLSTSLVAFVIFEIQVFTKTLRMIVRIARIIHGNMPSPNTVFKKINSNARKLDFIFRNLFWNDTTTHDRFARNLFTTR